MANFDGDVRAPRLWADLPLFPLPGVAFFPRTFMPLHVFEPRYRALVRTVLEADGMMGVVQLVRGDAQAQLPSPVAAQGPAVQRVTGVGRIVEYERLSDGRFLILLEGLARARVVRELATEEPFRRFELEEITEKRLDTASATRALDTLRGCIRALRSSVDEGADGLIAAAESASCPGALADLAASTLVEDPRRRQKLLETPCMASRVEEVVSFLSEFLLERRAPLPSTLN
jgi:Lon protease-like protein